MVDPYTCIRCGYKTNNKTNIKKHLYDRKVICPASRNDIELTNEIKEKIIKDRIYHIKKEIIESPIIQNITYNTMNNYIKKMDTFEKLDKYMEYKEKEIICLEDNVESHFQRRIENLKTDSFKFGYDMGNNRLFDVFEEITKIRNITDMNIVYNEKLKELSLFKSGSWETLLIERGIREILSILKEYFLDHYELFLFRRIYVIEKNEREKQKYRVHLEEYYKFIGTFDLRPIIEDKDDCSILGDNDGDFGVYKIEEKWMPRYKDIVDNLKRFEINKTKREIDLIIKNNSYKNINILNKEIIDLITNDEEFKKTLDLNILK